MFRTFLRVAFRSFRKNAFSTAINILGLTLGFGAFVVLSLFFFNELSYDRWHKKADRIFRFTTVDEALGVTSNEVAITNPRMPLSAMEEIPEVEIASRVMYAGEQRMEVGDKGYYSQYGLYVEKEFFDIFDLPLQNGDIATEAFDQPHKLIMTETFASQIFGRSADPLGQIVMINDQSWEVVGLMNDVKSNSHLGFDVLMSLFPAQSDSSLAQYIDSWNGLGMIGYAVLSDASKELQVEGKMAEIALANDVNDFWVPQLQALTDIHLGSSGILFDFYHIEPGDAVYTYAMGGVALFILLIAAFNFVNLTTAQSSGRAKEVGIRKVVGSTRSLLISQHLVESVLLSLMSLFLAGFGIGVLNETMGLGLDLDMTALVSTYQWLLPAYFVLAIVIGLLAGIYPAMVLSGIKAVSILRGRFQSSAKGVWLRKTLVVLQFVASIGMICITLLVSRQIDFIKNKQLGFDKDQIINISINGRGLTERVEAYRQTLEQNPDIVGVSYSSNMPGRTFGRSGVNVEGGNEDEPWIVSVMSMDDQYLDLMGIELVAGRNYGETFGTDEDESIIINEAMQEALGWEDAVGKKLVFGGETRRTVVGVIKDFHFANMRHKIEPLMVFYNPNPGANFNVKIRPEQMKATVDYLDQSWQAAFPNYPFDYQFFDQEFDQLFASDEFFSALVSTFTWLSIILSALGLFGLSFFMVEQRRKEIGVRKVLGSTIRQIIELLMKEFVLLIVLANLIAWPVAYVFLKHWIGDFEYRIDLFAPKHLLIYLAAGAGAVLITVLAVSYKSISAALANPIQSLRDE
ncbi:MAG: ABC transporter permease [Bacteroidota bacterium]